MVRVITIMDDVYVELSRLKRAKDLSFSGAIRYLLKERGKGVSLISLAGSVREEDVDGVTADRIERGTYGWRKYV